MRVILFGPTNNGVMNQVKDFLEHTPVDETPLSAVVAHPGAVEQIQRDQVQFEIALRWTNNETSELSDIRPLLAAIPVVILVAPIVDAPFCVQAMRLGVWDYINAAHSRSGGDVYQRVAASIQEACTTRRVREGSPAARWVHKNYASLAKQHAGKWIAANGTGVVDSAAALDELAQRIAQTDGILFWRMPELSK